MGQPDLVIGDRLVAVSQQLRDLQLDLLRPERVVSNATAVLCNVVEVGDVASRKFIDILVAKANDAKGFLDALVLVLIGVVTHLVNEAQARVRCRDRCQATDVLLCSKERDGCASVNSCERVRHEVHSLLIKELRSIFLESAGELLGTVFDRRHR